MAIPTVFAVGAQGQTNTAGGGTATPGLPTGTATGDLLLLFMETANQPVAAMTGWSNVGVGIVQQASGLVTALTVRWKIAGSGETAPSISAGTNDHVVARIIGVRGHDATTPINITATGVDNNATTTTSIPGATTSIANCLVFAAFSTGTDVTSTAMASGWTNASLASPAITEQCDNWHVTGNGGGFGVAAGGKATAGAYSATTVTIATANTKALMSFAVAGGVVTTSANADVAAAIGSAPGAVAAGAYRAEVAADSPTAWWHLEETAGASSFADVAGSNPLTIAGSPTLAGVGLESAAGLGLAASFSTATMNYGEHAATATFNGTGSGLTVEALVKSTGVDGNNRIVENGADTAWALYVEAGSLKFTVFGHASAAVTWSGGTARHHVVGTYDPATGTAILYLDGVEVGRETSTAGAPTTTTDPLRLAQKPTGTATGDGWPGTIDEPAIYGAVLTPTRIAAHAIAAGFTPAASATADVATGVGTAYDATVQTSSAGTQAPADVAAGTGQAFDSSVGVTSTADVAAGTGSAADASAGLAVTSGPVAASGAALDATAAAGASAGVSTGAGSAWDATAAVGVGSDVAAATGTGLDASASVSGSTTANADVATATGQGFDATVSTLTATSANAAPAAGAGTALDASTVLAAFAAADVALAAGSAWDAAATVPVLVGYTRRGAEAAPTVRGQLVSV